MCISYLRMGIVQKNNLRISRLPPCTALSAHCSRARDPQHANSQFARENRTPTGLNLSGRITWKISWPGQDIKIMKINLNGMKKPRILFSPSGVRCISRLATRHFRPFSLTEIAPTPCYSHLSNARTKRREEKFSNTLGAPTGR